MAMKLLEITSQTIADSYIRVCWKNVSITTTKKIIQHLKKKPTRQVGIKTWQSCK